MRPVCLNLLSLVAHVRFSCRVKSRHCLNMSKAAELCCMDGAQFSELLAKNPQLKFNVLQILAAEVCAVRKAMIGFVDDTQGAGQRPSNGQQRRACRKYNETQPSSGERNVRRRASSAAAPADKSFGEKWFWLGVSLRDGSDWPQQRSLSSPVPTANQLHRQWPSRQAKAS